MMEAGIAWVRAFEECHRRQQVRRHLIAAGVTAVSIGLVGASGVERSTVIVADGTTLVAPVAGVVPTTSSGTMAGVPVAAAVLPCGEWR